MTLNALGAHIYAGGFSIGVLDHFNVLNHLEEWQFGVATVKKNLGLNPRVGVDNWNASDYRGKVDFLFCNPPCVAWSMAGNKIVNKPEIGKHKSETDDRVDCTRRCFGLINQVQPRVFVWECVTQAWKNGEKFVREMGDLVAKQGYDSTVVLFDAFMTGLPQHRNRMFFVAHQCDFDPRAPMTPGKTVGEVLAEIKADFSPHQKPTSTHVRLIAKLVPNKEQQLLKIYNAMVKSGEITEKIRTTSTGTQYRCGRPAFMNWRLGSDKPARTFGGHPDYIHPTKDRYLSVLESQLLCGYPEDYEFCGTMLQQYAQVAKAVTPPAGRWIAGEVKRALLANKPRKNRPLKLVDFIKNQDGYDF